MIDRLNVILRGRDEDFERTVTEWLAEQGYERETRIYREVGNDQQTAMTFTAKRKERVR